MHVIGLRVEVGVPTQVWGETPLIKARSQLLDSKPGHCCCEAKVITTATPK